MRVGVRLLWYGATMSALLACITLFSSDRKEIGENKKELATNRSLYRKYKRKNIVMFWSHQSWAESYPTEARKQLLCALDDQDLEAVHFYAKCLGNKTIPDFKKAITDGRVDRVALLLPTLRLPAQPSYAREREGELRSHDYSGLTDVVAAEIKTGDATRIKLMNTIIDFYTPTVECQEGCLVGALCPLQCQARRRAFVAYGLAKAGVEAIKRQRSTEVIHYIFDTHGAFVSTDAVKAAQENKERDLEKKLTSTRCGQLADKAGQYELLTRFNSISRPLHEAVGYYSKLARPTINQGIVYQNPDSLPDCVLALMQYEKPLCPKK